MKRIVISGATSMIGVALINVCIENKTQVCAFVRGNTSRMGRLPKSDLVEVFELDLTDIDGANVDAIGHCDVFYHFAWGHTIKQERDLPLFQENNILSTLQAVQLASRLGCSTFVGAGSQAEYGPCNDVIGPETPTKPTSSYGMAKLSAGLLGGKLCSQLGMRFVWGRVFSVYGCNDNDGTMLNYTIDAFLDGKEAKFSSEGTQMWNYLFESDAGRFFYLLGTNEEASGVYCIANNESKKLSKYIDTVRSYFSMTRCTFTPPSTHRSANVTTEYGLIADISKTIKDTGGYMPLTSFEEGIRQVINHKIVERGGMGSCEDLLIFPKL